MPKGSNRLRMTLDGRKTAPLARPVETRRSGSREPERATQRGFDRRSEPSDHKARKAFSAAEISCSVAGIGVKGLFSESNAEDWCRQIDTNLYGTIRCTHAAIPLMRGRKGAMICSVSSVAGRSGRAGWAVYSATKFAVTGFHDALRKELGQDGIRVDPRARLDVDRLG